MNIGISLRKKILAIILVLSVSIAGGTDAFAAIAKISKCTGEVIVQSGGELRQITAPGAPLNDGDQIQTKQGEAEVLFEDGAVLKINSFTNAMLNERAEKEGWLFKSVTQARRITCFVGKMFFQSGAPGTKNYLQTPTAVAGLRGTSADFGFNPERTQSLLNMYSGNSDTVGNVLRGFFSNPGISAAQKSEVFRNLERAYSLTVATQQANRGPGVTPEQRTINTAQANLAALAVVTQAAQILVQSNPDPTAKSQAQASLAIVNTNVNAVQVRVEVARTEIVRQAAIQEVQKAQAEGNAQKLAAAQKVVATATAALTQAQTASRQVEQQVTQAERALAQGNLTQVQQIEQQVQREVQQVQRQTQVLQQQSQNIITTVPTTVLTTVETTVVSTTTATTAATTTTVMPTTITSTTTSTTSSSTTTSSVTPSH